MSDLPIYEKETHVPWLEHQWYSGLSYEMAGGAIVYNEEEDKKDILERIKRQEGNNGEIHKGTMGRD
jgi:hypothetical protein